MDMNFSKLLEKVEESEMLQYMRSQRVRHNLATEQWQHYSIVYVLYIFFIHLSVNGHLGFFHVLAIVNISAVDTGVPVSFWIVLFSGMYPVVGLLGHMAALFLVFEESPYCSPK